MGVLKRIGKSVKKAVSSPVRAVGRIARGDLKGATKDLGQTVGATINIGTLGMASSSRTQKMLGESRTMNRLLLGVPKDLRNYYKGSQELEQKGETNSKFYKAAGSLAAKGAGGYYLATSGVGAAWASKGAALAKGITGKQVLTTAATATLLKKSGGSSAEIAAQMSGIDPSLTSMILPEKRRSINNDYSSLSDSYSPPSDDVGGGSGMISLLGLGVAGVLGYFLYKGKFKI